MSQEPNPDGVAVIVGNRHYADDRVPEVTYAHRDADAFKRYVLDVHGFDEDNIIDLRDATQAKLMATFGNDRGYEGSMLWRYLDPEGRSDVLVYYSGHGVPGLEDRKGYLLPVDANPDTVQLNGYPIDWLYANLGRMTEAASVRVYLDACFSGGSDGGMLIRAASPVFVSAALPDTVVGTMAVLTAALGDQVASWDEGARHGLFTHHLLDALYGKADANADGKVTALETKQYLDRHMTRAARRTFGRVQQASLMGAATAALSLGGPAGFPKRPGVGEASPRSQPFTVLTEPDSARVRILNIAERYGPGMELPAGEYRVEASLEGHETIVEMVDHGSEGATEHRIALLRSAQPFTVVTEPAGARVRFLSIEDRYRPGMELVAGEYRVEASLEGYETIMKVVRHGSSGATQYRIALRRQWTPGRRFRDCPDCPEMVVVPAGRFRMGCLSSDDACQDREKPVRTVRIDALFALSAHEVTFSEWDACVSAGGCGGHRPGDRGWGRGDRPVINVSWDDARSYVSWLSRRTGETYRLPSESEWEYAARAGSTSKYSWGNEVGRNRANCNGCGSRWDGQRTAPVGSFAPNEFGLYDMHGNVYEWVEDCWNGSYASAPSDGGARLSGDCAERVLRGGSWFIDPRDLRAAYRLWSSTGFRVINFGFRVARTLTP